MLIYIETLQSVLFYIIFMEVTHDVLKISHFNCHLIDLFVDKHSLAHVQIVSPAVRNHKMAHPQPPFWHWTWRPLRIGTLLVFLFLGTTLANDLKNVSVPLAIDDTFPTVSNDLKNNTVSVVNVVNIVKISDGRKQFVTTNKNGTYFTAPYLCQSFNHHTRPPRHFDVQRSGVSARLQHVHHLRDHTKNQATSHPDDRPVSERRHESATQTAETEAAKERLAEQLFGDAAEWHFVHLYQMQR